MLLQQALQAGRGVDVECDCGCRYVQRAGCYIGGCDLQFIAGVQGVVSVMGALGVAWRCDKWAP
jgi:hypothetical protein